MYNIDTVLMILLLKYRLKEIIGSLELMLVVMKE